MEVEAGSLSVGVGKRGLETGGQDLPSSPPPPSSFRLPGGEDVANGR